MYCTFKIHLRKSSTKELDMYSIGTAITSSSSYHSLKITPKSVGKMMNNWALQFSQWLLQPEWALQVQLYTFIYFLSSMLWGASALYVTASACVMHFW